MANSLITLAVESAAHEGGGLHPYVIGVGTLVLLLVLLLAVVAFGGGREHS